MNSNTSLLRQYSVVPDWARRLIFGSALVRGFVGCFTAISMAAEAIGLANYEIARAINAVIIGWSFITGAIGSWIGKLPFIPELSASTVNMLMFLGSVTIPAIFGLSAFVAPLTKGPPLKNERMIYWGLKWGFPICFGYIFIFGTVLFGGMNFNTVAFSNEGLFGRFFELEFTHRLSMFVVCIAFQFLFAFHIKAFRVGAYVLAGALLAVELCYFAPIIGPYIRAGTAYLEQQYGPGKTNPDNQPPAARH